MHISLVPRAGVPGMVLRQEDFAVTLPGNNMVDCGAVLSDALASPLSVAQSSESINGGR